MKCRNCNLDLKEEENFCKECGAKVIRNRLTLKNLWAEVSERFLNYDNAFAKTFKDLFSKPVEVIDGFILGLRKKYVNPVNYVAITATYSGLVFYLIKKFRPGFYGNLNFQGQNQEAFSEFMNGIMDFQGFLYFLSIPFMAIVSMIVFMNIKKYNFTEQNVIYMYTGAQSSVLTSTLILLTLPFYTVAPLALNIITYAIMVGFNGYVLKKLFNLSLKRILFKTLVFFFVAFTIYIMLIVVVGLMIGAYFLITGDIPEAFIPVKD
ncbi:DUF3667 domain-containing protein [Ascidiimonas sp. W6]|uniref:DUF3667 domain-containing protein n=1 Tax=Ascidiimonas meishanensis TaxID=3128903 RepID=UPI0030EDFF36